MFSSHMIFIHIWHREPERCAFCCVKCTKVTFSRLINFTNFWHYFVWMIFRSIFGCFPFNGNVEFIVACLLQHTTQTHMKSRMSCAGWTFTCNNYCFENECLRYPTAIVVLDFNFSLKIDKKDNNNNKNSNFIKCLHIKSNFTVWEWMDDNSAGEKKMQLKSTEVQIIWD